MKKCQKVLSIVLTVLMLLSVVTLFAFAAETDKTKYNVNKIEVKTYQELMTALETKSDKTNPEDLYVVLQNDISEEWDGYTDIIITYPGNVTLDMNSYNISMTSPNGDTMFFLKGENPTNFSIINTGALVNSRISFESASYGSSLILSQNPNANLNLIGEYTKYDTENTDSNAVWNHDINFYTSSISDDDEQPHYTVCLSKINRAYITGVELKNFAKQPINLFVDEAKDLLITGKSELLHYGWDRIGANVILNSEYSNTYNLYGILGSCYIQGDWKTATDYQSIRVSGRDSFDWKWLLYDTSGTPSGSTQMPDYTTVYNSDAVADSKRAVNTYRDIFVKRNCCEQANPSRQTNLTMLGHVTKCLDCGSTPSYKLHSFTLKTRQVIPTCNSQGKIAYYECSVENCTYCKGGETLPKNANNHPVGKVITSPAVEPTCTENGSTEGKLCQACRKMIVAKKEIPALGHDFGAWTTTKEATCTQAGSKQHTCLTCGEVETATIAATAHNYGSYKVTTKATCTKDGVKTKTCADCGKK